MNIQIPNVPALDSGHGADVTIPRLYNFAEDVLARNQKAGRGGKAAYVDSRGTWSFDQLAERMARFGNLLRDLGIQREQRILICLTDTIDFPTSFLGAVKAGVVVIPVNTLLSETEYRLILEDSRARLLIVSEELYPLFANLIDSSPDLEHILVSGNQGFGHALFEDALKAATATEYTAPTVSDEICFWLYTSGSTGTPKAAVHIHAALGFTAACYGAQVLRLTADDVVYSVSKLFFAYGLGNSMVHPLSAGATTVLASERPTPNSVANLMRTHGITVFFAVPTFYTAFLAGDPVEREAVRLRCCLSAGEALPIHIGQAWRERFAVDIFDGLGSTEMLSTFLTNRPEAMRPGTSGKPVPGYALRLVDEAGANVAQGEIGELQVRGPTTAIMYWNDRERSRSTFLGEWLRSGDKYIQDKDGYYVYCGRRDDMMKVGGIYVAPFEVEGALLSHPDVLEAAVAACLDEDGLIRPKAFVILKPSGKPNEATALALRDHCRKQLATFKYPRWIEFRTELPKTATGKIQRFKLRKETARDDGAGPTATENGDVLDPLETAETAVFEPDGTAGTRLRGIRKTEADE